MLHELLPIPINIRMQLNFPPGAKRRLFRMTAHFMFNRREFDLLVCLFLPA